MVMEIIWKETFMACLMLGHNNLRNDTQSAGRDSNAGLAEYEVIQCYELSLFSA